MSNFLACQSSYSILKSILKPSQIVEMAAKYEQSAAAIVDISSMAGIVQFHEAATKAGIKPILGFTAQFSDHSSISLLATNKSGYKILLQILAEINSHENYFRHPCISYDILNKYDLSNVLCLTGHFESTLYRALFPSCDEVLEGGWEVRANIHLGLLVNAFSTKNIYVQVEPHFDKNTTEIYNKLAQEHELKICYTNNIKFDRSEDSKYLFDIVRAINEKTTVRVLTDLPSIYHPHIDSSLDYGINREISDRCESYEITGPPKLPKFQCPNNQESIDYLKEICRQGFRNKVLNQGLDKNVYGDRVKYELSVFEETGLSDYFLALWDIIKFAESEGNLVGIGRGSAAGCLISYLLGITKFDPIKYNLVFERFFNKGRAGSLPDIDVDFPKRSRNSIIQYIIDKYGADRVGQVVTYSTLMGRAAITGVLRAEGGITFQEMKDITKNIVDKSKISDELQEMKEAGRNPSVIMWALENKRNRLKDWAELDTDEETIIGPMSKQFRMAIQLEGVKSAQSKHASAVIVSTDSLENVSPILYDKNSRKGIVGLEYEDAEKCSLLKLDILGVSTLDRIQDINT